jgi:hypothetical protein
VPINPPHSSHWMTSCKGCRLRMYCRATPYPYLGSRMGRLPMNTGSGVSTLFLRKNHTFCHPTGGLDIKTQKYGSAPGPNRANMSTLPPHHHFHV